MVHRSGSTLIIAPKDADRKKQLKNNIRTNEAKIFTDSQNIPEFLDELDQCAVSQEANKKQSLPQQQNPIKTSRISRSTIQNRSPCKTLTTPKKARERRSDNTDELSQDIKESTSPIRIRSGLRSHSLESSNVIRTNNDDSTQSSQQPLPIRRGRKFKKKRNQGNTQLGGGRICNIQNANELSTELPQKLTCSLPLDRLSGFLDAILSRHCHLANDSSTLEDATAQTDTSSSIQTPVDASDSKGHSSNNLMTKSLCLYCDKKFSSQKVRTKHTERVHAISKGRRLSSRNSLSCPSNLSYPGCSYCCYNSNKLKTVTVSEDLKMLFHHLVDYHADKYFACKICAIRFSTPEELEEHIGAKHKIIGNPIKNKGTGMVKRGRNSSLDSNLVRLETAVSQLLHVDTGCSDNKPIGNLDDNSMDPESTPTKTRRQLKQAMENKPLATRSCQNVLRNDETILSRLGVAQNRLPRGRKGIRNRRLCNLEPTKPEVLHTVKTRSKVGRVITTNVMDPVEPIPRPPTNSRVETLSCTFDEDFYENVSINVRKNLSCHLDGKLEGGPTSPSPQSPFPSFPAIRSTVVKSPLTNDSEIHEATNLSAVTAFPTLLTAEQYGSDLAGTAKIRKPITKHSWKWKWDCVKKYKYVNEGGKIVKKIKQPMMGSRDLSKLDMWTQLTMRTKHEMVRRQSYAVNGFATSLDVGEVARDEKIQQIGELNTILDTRRLPQIILEQSDQTIIKIEIPEDTNLAICTSPSITSSTLQSLQNLPSNCDYENFPQCLNLNRRDPQSTGSEEDIVLSGEWARPRSYICFGCGAKFDKLKSLEEHKIFRHPYVYSTHYEIVGRELIEGDLYKHFYIPTKALNKHREYRLRVSKQIDGECAKINETCTCGDESMDSINSAPVSCSTTSRSDCDLECKTVFASTSSSVTTSIEIEEESIIQFTGKFSGSCTKCNRECHGILDLYRHILDCSGDYAWILAKKRKYRYFGSRKRKHTRHNLALARRSRALIKREKSNDDSPQKVKSNQTAPRPPRPSDAESIRRMLENLPAKRACRQIIPNITKPRVRKNQTAIGKKKGILVKGRNTRRTKGNVASTTVTAISKNILRSHKRIYTRRLQQVRNNRTRSSIKRTEEQQAQQQKQQQQIELKSSLEDAQSSNVSKDNNTEKGVMHNIGRKTKRFVKKITQKFQSNKRVKKKNNENIEDDDGKKKNEEEEISKTSATENCKDMKGESSMKHKKVMKNSNLLRKFSFRKSSRKDSKDTKPNKPNVEKESTENTNVEEESKVQSTEPKVEPNNEGTRDKKLPSNDNVEKISDEVATEPKKIVKKKSLKKILNKIKEKTKKLKTEETENNLNDPKENNDQDTNGNGNPSGKQQQQANSNIDKNPENLSLTNESCDEKEDNTPIEININDEPLNLSIPVQPILQVSPTTKRRGKKLNDCIAMLTGKLQEKLGKPFFESNENLDSALSAISRQSSTTDISNYHELSSVHSASINDIPGASSNECINFRQSAEDLSEFDKKNQKSAKRKTVTRRIIKKNNVEDLSTNAAGNTSNNTSYNLTVTTTTTTITSSSMTTTTTKTITTATTTSSSLSTSFGYDPSKCVLLKPPVLKITTSDFKATTIPQKENLFEKNKCDEIKVENIKKTDDKLSVNNVSSCIETNKVEIDILSRNNTTTNENISKDLSFSMQSPPITYNAFDSLLDLRLVSNKSNEDSLKITDDPLESSTPKSNARGKKAITRKGVKKKQNSDLNMLPELPKGTSLITTASPLPPLIAIAGTNFPKPNIVCDKILTGSEQVLNLSQKSDVSQAEILRSEDDQSKAIINVPVKKKPGRKPKRLQVAENKGGVVTATASGDGCGDIETAENLTMPKKVLEEELQIKNIETLPTDSNKQTKITHEKEENLTEPIILVENDSQKLLEIEDNNKSTSQIELNSKKDKILTTKKIGKKKLETKIAKLQQKNSLDLLDMSLPKTHDIVKDIPIMKKRKSIKNLTVETQNLENSSIDISDALPISDRKQQIKIKKVGKVITKKLSPNHEIEQDPTIISQYEGNKEQNVAPENINNEICATLNEFNTKSIETPAALEVLPVAIPPAGKKKPGRKPKIKESPSLPEPVKPTAECSNKEEVNIKPDNKEEVNPKLDNKEDDAPMPESIPPCVDDKKIETIKETKKYTRKTSFKKTENIKTKQSDGITLKPAQDNNIDENNSDNDISTIISIVPEEVTLTDFKLPNEVPIESPVNNIDKAVKSKLKNYKKEENIGDIIKTGRKLNATSISQVDKQNYSKNNETPIENVQNLDTVVVKRRSNRNKPSSTNDENKEKILELQRALSEAEEIIASFLSDDLDQDTAHSFKDKPTRLDDAETILTDPEEKEILENKSSTKDFSNAEPSTSNLQSTIEQKESTEEVIKTQDKTTNDSISNTVKKNVDVNPEIICKEFYINLQNSQQDILQYQEKMKATKLAAQSTVSETRKSTNEPKFTIATRKGTRRKAQIEIESEILSPTITQNSTQENESQQTPLKEDNKINNLEAIYSVPQTSQKRGKRRKDLQQNTIDISSSTPLFPQGTLNQNTTISIDAASAAAVSIADNKKSQPSKNLEENNVESIISDKLIIPAQQEQEHATTIAQLDETSILSNLKSQDGSETDIPPQRPDSAAKKQRKRRKNELAAIVADQLLESFKEVDKSRLDDLKMLENLAYEKSEDLLLTGMRLTPTTKRKISLPETNIKSKQKNENENCKSKIRSRSQPNTKPATDESSVDMSNKNETISKKRKTSDSKILNIHENLFRSLPKCDEPLKLNVEPMSQKHNFRIGSNFNTTQFEVFSTFKSSFDNFRSLTDFSFMTRKDAIRKSNFVPGSAETSNSVDSHSLRLQEDLTKSNDATEKSKHNFQKKLKKKFTRKKDKVSENENINELRSGLESFTFGKEIQGEVAVKAFGFFSSANRPGIIARSLFSTSTPELSSPFNKLNETQTVSLQSKKPFLRPSILSATLDTSRSVSVSECNLQTENIKHVSSRDPRLNKNKHQPPSDKEDNYEPIGFEKRKLGSLRLRRKSERDTSHGNKNAESDELNIAFLRPRERLRSSRRIKDLKSFKNDTKNQKNQKEISDVDDNSQSDEDDNYLAQIAKSVNDKILSSDNEDDGFEMANSTAAALLLASERPPRPSTSMSLRSMPNFNDDQSNADFLHEDENTNTELIDMDLEDDISCYTSFSQDVSRFRRGGKLGMRRRRRKSILLTRKPKKTNFADTSLEEFHCDMCNKTFRKAIALSKHQMTLSHIAKLSEYEYLNASKQNKEPSPKPIEEKESHQHLNYPIELSPSPEDIDIEAEQPEPAEELVDEGEATAAMPVETEVPTAIPDDVNEKPNTPHPVVVNLLSQSGIEPISSPEQVETNYERYNNTSSRIALSQEERLFYECCNMLKGSETPMVERTYPVIPSTFSAYDVPNKPVTPKSSERFSYLGSEASGSFHHGTAYTVKSPMSQSRTSPRHAYPKIDINQFSDISSDSNPAFPRAQPHPNLQSNLNNYPSGNMINHKYPPYNQSPLRDGNVQTGMSTFVPEVAARSYQGAYYTGESSFTPAQFPIGTTNRTVASLTARTFVNDDPGKSFVPLRESATMPGYPLEMQERNRDVIGQQQTFTSPLHSTSSQGSTTTTCRMKTKAAMKGYDNFKVSIPTLGLDMQQALERSPHGGCKLTALAEIALGSEAPITPTRYPPTPVQDEEADKTRAKPVINEKFVKKYEDLIKSNIKPPAAAPKVIKKKEYSEKTGNKLGFKAKKNKQKVLKSVQISAEKPPEKPKDIYEFDDSEEMVQNIVKSPAKGRNAKGNEEKIIIPERPFKNIGLDEQQSIKFHKPEGTNEKTEEDSLSTTSYSDRDDFNYGSMSDDNEDQDNQEQNDGSSDSESNSSARTAKTIENKCLIMGRIFKNATKNRAEEKKQDKIPTEPKKKIPIQELDKLFDKLREDPETQRETSTPKVDNSLKETEQLCAEEEEEEGEEGEEEVKETPEVAPDFVMEENHKKDTVKMDVEGDQTVGLPEINNDGDIEKDEASDNNDNIDPTVSGKEKRRKPRMSRKDTQQNSKEIYRLQSELGMSAEEIAELIGEGQRKSQRRCAANQTRKFVEIWSSDEYEEFLSTKDVIAFIEEKEKKSRKRKSGSRNNEKKKSFDNSSRIDVSASATNTQDKIEKIDKENQEVIKDDKSIKSKSISSNSNTNKKPEKIVDKLLEKLSKPQKCTTNAGEHQQQQQQKSQQPQKDGIKKPTQNSTKHEKDSKKQPEKLNKTSSQKKPTLSVKPRIKNKNEDSESDFETEWRGGGRSKIKKRRKTICVKEQENGKKILKTTDTGKKTTITGKGKGNNKLSENSDKKSPQPPNETSRPLARRKRVASEMLYYWSSSSDEEFGRIETRDDDDDDLTPEGEHYQQHGWIVGDSHKKLVTLLAIAKGKKVEDCGVKETVHKKKS